MPRTRLRQGGFTLLEIMIVVAIIGVLASYFSGFLVTSARQARGLQAYSDAVQLENDIRQMIMSPDTCKFGFLQDTAGNPMAFDPTTVSTTVNVANVPVPYLKIGANVAANTAPGVTSLLSAVSPAVAAATVGVTVTKMEFNQLMSSIAQPAPSTTKLSYLNFHIEGMRRAAPSGPAPSSATTWSNDYTVALQTDSALGNKVVGCTGGTPPPATPGNWNCYPLNNQILDSPPFITRSCNPGLDKILFANCGYNPIYLTAPNAAKCLPPNPLPPGTNLTIICCK